MKETLKGTIFIIAAMALFGFMGIFVRFLDLPSHIILFFSFIIPGIFLLIFFLIKDKKIIVVKKYLWLILLMGLFNILNNFFYFQSYINTTISNAVLTHYTAPIFVALLAPLLIKERLEKVTIFALIFSIIGLLLITYQNFSLASNDFIGITYGICSGFFYALVIIVVKFLSKHLSIFTIHTYQSISGGIILLPFFIKSNIVFDINIIFLLIVFSIIFGIIGPLLHFFGIKRIKSQHAAILAYVEPIFASIYALIFFFEIPSLNTVFGGISIIFSGYLIIRREK